MRSTPDIDLMQPLACTGPTPGKLYNAPGRVMAVYVRGILQRPGVDYAAPAEVIELTYATEEGDQVYALCF